MSRVLRSIMADFGSLIFLCAMFCCMGTETGNPPAIDSDAIYLQKADIGVRMVGEERAVTPGQSMLRIVDLDAVSEPVDIQVDKDGSFRVDLDGGLDHLYRLRAMFDGVFSKPVNVSGEAVQENACIRVEPAELIILPKTSTGKTARASIRLTNTCDKDVVLLEQWIRLRAAPIEFQALELPQPIQPDETLTVDVTFSPNTSGSYESIVVYSFDLPGRVVVDVSGEAEAEGESSSNSSNDSPFGRVRARPGECYGDATFCSTLPDPISSGYPTSQTADLTETSDMSVEWMEMIESLDCPLPPCYPYQAVIAVAPDDSVSIATKVLVEAKRDAAMQWALWDNSRETGVWFARYTANGERVSQQLVDFRLASATSYWQFTPSVAVDSQGMTYLSVLSQRHPNEGMAEDGELFVYQYDDQGELLAIPITRYGLQAASVFVDSNDDIVLLTHYRNRTAGDELVDVDQAYGQDPVIPTQADISKYDRDGVLIWNQVGLNGSAISTEITDLALDASGGITVAVKQLMPDLNRVWTIARLDDRGAIDWMRPLPNPQHRRVGDVGISVVPDGNVSVISTIEVSSEIDGEIAWGAGEVLFDRYSAIGGARWSWRIPALTSYKMEFNSANVDDSRGYSMLIDSTYIDARIIRFTPDGKDLTVSTIDQIHCGQNGVSSDIYDPNVAAVCGSLALEMSPSDRLYFRSQFAGKLDAVESGSTGEYWSIPDDYPLESIVAFGRLLGSQE